MADAHLPTSPTSSKRPASDPAVPPVEPSQRRTRVRTSSPEAEGATGPRALAQPHDGPAVDASSSPGASSTSSSSRTYSLSIVQQPRAGAEYGGNVLARLPLGPPLIVKVDVSDRDGSRTDMSDVNLSTFVAHLSLVAADPDSTEAIDLVWSPGGTRPPKRMLYGTLAASPYELDLVAPPVAGPVPAGEDESAASSSSPSPGIFFVFPEVSVSHRGRYRLRIALHNLARQIESDGRPLATVITEPFEITSFETHSALPVTPITASVASQGVPMFLPRSTSSTSR